MTTQTRPTIHELKTSPANFDAVRKGRKTFELRRDDRDFQVRDWLLLREWEDGVYTGRSCIVCVVHILRHADPFGEMLAPGVGVLGVYPYREPRSI